MDKESHSKGCKLYQAQNFLNVVRIYIYIYIYIYIVNKFLMVSVFANGPGDLGQSQVESYQRLKNGT